MKTEDEPDVWRLVDSWWPEDVESYSALTSDDTARVLEGTRLADQWPTLDAWWGTYTETGHSTIVDVAAVLNQVTEHWRTSDGSFDPDPLDANVTTAGAMRGPLRPSREENWSQCLAQLLRPSAKLITELFGEDVGQAPVLRSLRSSRRYALAATPTSIGTRNLLRQRLRLRLSGGGVPQRA